MNETVNLLLALAAGIGLGVVYFGGLWWTVTRALAAPRPALWFLVSLVLRMGIAMAGFYIVAQKQWDMLLACLLGFVAGRAAVTWLTRPSAGPGEEARHAH